MKDRRKIYTVIVSLALVLVITSIFFGLSFHKSDEAWIETFQESLTVSRDQNTHGMRRSIEIWQLDVLAASFTQEYFVDLTGELPYARLTVEEKFFVIGTNEFDFRDEFVLEDGIMTVTRETYNETINASYSSDLAAFWQLVSENEIGGASYNLSVDNFSEFNITHNGEYRILSANVSNTRVAQFFGNPDAVSLNNVVIEMSMDSRNLLSNLKLSYESEVAGVPSTTIIKIEASQSLDIDKSWPGYRISLLTIMSASGLAVMSFITFLIVQRIKASHRKNLFELKLVE